jgi:hypothetical protein
LGFGPKLLQTLGFGPKLLQTLGFGQIWLKKFWRKEGMDELCAKICEMPQDIQNYILHLVYELRKPKPVLPIVLQQDIETFHLLPCILKNYKCLEPQIETHMFWAENAMIHILNKNRSLLDYPLEPSIRALFPKLSNDDEIRLELMHKNNLYKTLWRGMNAHQRCELYDLSWELCMELSWPPI